MSRAPYVSIHLDASNPGRDDLVRAVIREIDAGRLSPGLRLPPVRELARRFGLSKNTVQAAYEELAARGRVEARAREGVFVATGVEAVPPVHAISPPSPRLRPMVMQRRDAPADAVSMSTVFIDPALLPTKQLADCFRSVLAEGKLRPFYDPQGHPLLREAIAERLGRRGMEVRAEDVIITTGSQQALDMVARSLTDKRVAVEDPVYAHARRLFHTLGVELVPLPLDPFDGVSLDAWEARLAIARPSLLYAITSYQNPTGYSYTTSELTGLLELADRHDFALLEDDWGSDMLSGQEYRPTLRALGGENVLYANSFTKKLLPALRIGFLVATPDTKETLIGAKRVATLGNAMVLEEVLFEFLDRGYYDAHLARLQEALDTRYRACIEALRALMPPGVRFSTPGGGPTLWLELPEGANPLRVRESLLRQGFEVEQTTDHFDGTPHLCGFRISYAFLPEETMHRGLEALAEVLREET